MSQELSLVPQLDVTQNIFLGQTAALDIVPRGRHREAAVEILQALAPHLRVDTRVSKLGMADRQLVEISRTLARGGRIIAFDEPTSSLTPQERDGLFLVIRGLRDAGNAIIYISHRMEEIRAIADRFTVMRDGKVIATDAMERWRVAQRISGPIRRRYLSSEICLRLAFVISPFFVPENKMQGNPTLLSLTHDL